MIKTLLFPFFILLGITSTYADSNNITHPKIKWMYKTQGSIRSAPAIDEKNIYCGSSDGSLYAMDKNNGELVWKFETSGAISGDLKVSADFVIFCSRDNHVYAVERGNGHLAWSFEMQTILQPPFCGWDYFSAAPIIEGDRVFVGSGDGHLYALNLETGKLEWKFETSQRIRASSYVADGVVYQPSNDGRVYALNQEDGTLLWKFETEGATLNSDEYGYDRNSIFDQPEIKDGILVFGSRDGNVYGIDIQTREEKWKFAYDGTWSMTSIIDEETVYVGWSTNDMVCALDLHTGQEKWKYQCGAHNYATPFVSGEVVYFASGDGRLYQFDKNSGQKKWEYEIGSEIFSSPVFDGKTIYFGADNGFLYALEEGVTPCKAVYQPTELPTGLEFLLIDAKITPFLTDHGFVQLKTESALAEFLSSRVEDKIPSVVVLAFDGVPHEVIGDKPEQGLLRQYLESGGKILSFGSVLNLYTIDDQGNFHRDYTAAEQLLEVTFPEPYESGSYFSKSTQQGLNSGMPDTLATTNPTVAEEGVIPLAYDEYQRISAWIKKFSPKPGSGFISCRSWGYNVDIKTADLDLMLRLANGGLE